MRDPETRLGFRCGDVLPADALSALVGQHVTVDFMGQLTSGTIRAAWVVDDELLGPGTWVEMDVDSEVPRG